MNRIVQLLHVLSLRISKKLASKGSTGMARAILHICIKLPAAPPETFLALSFFYLKQNKKERSLRIVESGLRFHPQNSRLQLQKAITLYDSGYQNDALETVKKSLISKPLQISAYLFCAKLLEEMGKVSEARLMLLQIDSAQTRQNPEFMQRLAHLTFLCRADLPSSGSDRICTIQGIYQFAIEHGCLVHHVQDPEVLEVSRPNIYGDSEPVSTGAPVSNPLYVAELTNVIAHSRKNVLVHGNNALSDFASHTRGARVQVEDRDFVVAQLQNEVWVHATPNPQQEERGIMLFGEGSVHYGHWIYEYLPKILYFESLPQYKSWPIFVDEGMPPTHLESLRLMIEPGQEIRVLPKDSTVVFKRLVYLSYFSHTPMYFKQGIIPEVEDGPTSDRALSYLSTKLSRTQPKGPKRERLYLSRKSSSWRVLTNEQEVEMVFHRYGFRSLALEGTSFADMLDIFSRAEYIAGPSGSAMNNLVFAPSDCKALVLSPPQIGNYASWASTIKRLGHPIAFLCGSNRTSEQRAEKHASYSIDLNLLSQTLRNELIIPDQHDKSDFPRVDTTLHS